MNMSSTLTCDKDSCELEINFVGKITRINEWQSELGMTGSMGGKWRQRTPPKWKKSVTWFSPNSNFFWSLKKKKSISSKIAKWTLYLGTLKYYNIPLLLLVLTS